MMANTHSGWAKLISLSLRQIANIWGVAFWKGCKVWKSTEPVQLLTALSLHLLKLCFWFLRNHKQISKKRSKTISILLKSLCLCINRTHDMSTQGYEWRWMIPRHLLLSYKKEGYISGVRVLYLELERSLGSIVCAIDSLNRKQSLAVSHDISSFFYCSTK